MSKSHGHQQVALLDGLVKRAIEKKAGLSKQAMVLSYGFDNEEQLNHAIRVLVDGGAIKIDIDGRFPSFRIFKKKLKSLHPLGRPLFLSAGKPLVAAGAEVKDWRDTSVLKPPAAQPAAISYNDGAPVSSLKPRENLADAMAARAADEPNAVEAAIQLETERDQTIPFYVGFRLPKEDFNWLVDEMDRSGQSTALPAFARDMLMAEMDRRRTPAAPRHKISARVLRTAREEGLDLDTFITSLIEVGLTAREMNRRGV